MKRLYDIAHARAGDKGETSNIAVFCYKKEDYQLLDRKSTRLNSSHVSESRMPSSA